MKLDRSAGILLHPTSLPGKYGIGDLGKDAYQFIDFLSEAGLNLWQVFPLGPTGYGDSPYQCFSAFAGNPLLINFDLLIDYELLSEEDLHNIPGHDPKNIDYGQVINYKYKILRKAFDKYKNDGIEIMKGFDEYCEKNQYWLNDFALFMASKNYHGGKMWKEWDEEIALRKPGAVEKWTKKLQIDIEYNKFLQFIFDHQWKKLRDYAHEKNITIIGDLPIFIAYDSSDCWANKDLFTVDDEGNLEKVAGVPPDYFSETGQLWGNPLYRWKTMESNNFGWWQQRIRKMLETVDIIRIDHFRGFEAYWEIPGDAETAIDGRWVKAPGEKLFETIKEKFGKLPIIAEDLGVITKEVEALRDQFDFPGIKIMQFAFGPTGERKFLPHNYPRNCVVHTGSHDNDTTRGFFDKAKEKDPEIYKATQDYLNYYGDDICQELIRAAFASVSDIVIIPLQDVLNLGGEARMNFPGTLGGNWTWRFTWDQITDDLVKKYKNMGELYDRPPQTIDNEEIEVEEN